MNTFTLGDAFSNGWRITKSNFLFLLGVIVVVFIVQFGLSAANGYFNEEMPAVGVVFSIVTILVQVLLNVGAISIVLKLVDGQQASFKELFTTTRPYLQFILVTLLVTVIVGLGFILLIIPGIILAIGLQFATYMVVDKNMKAVQAIKASWAMTKGVKGKLFGLALVVWLVNVIGLVLFGVGLLVTIPLTTVIMAYVYRTLEKQVQDNVVVASLAAPVPTTPEAQI